MTIQGYVDIVTFSYDEMDTAWYASEKLTLQNRTPNHQDTEYLSEKIPCL